MTMHHDRTEGEHLEDAAGGHAAYAGHSSHASHALHGHGGHGDHAALFRRRFWVCFVLTIPTVVYSHMAQHVLGFTAP